MSERGRLRTLREVEEQVGNVPVAGDDVEMLSVSLTDRPTEEHCAVGITSVSVAEKEISGSVRAPPRRHGDQRLIETKWHLGKFGLDLKPSVLVRNDCLQHAVVPPPRPLRQNPVARQLLQRREEITTGAKDPLTGRNARVNEHDQSGPGSEPNRDTRKYGSSSAVTDEHDWLVGVCRLDSGFGEPGWVAGRCSRDQIRHDGFVPSLS